MRSPRSRFVLTHMAPMSLLGLVLVTTAVFAREWYLWIFLGSILATAVWYGWIRWGWHWRSYRSEEKETFAATTAELSFVSDHRDFLGKGKICNHIHHPSWDAFEIVNGLRRRWWFAVPLNAEHPVGSVRPFRANNGVWPGDKSFHGNYVIDGVIPQSVRDVLVSVPHHADIHIVGNYLFATGPVMTKGYFPWWRDNVGSIVLAVADALNETARPIQGEQAALSPSNPARNVWAPEAALQPEEQPAEGIRWNQPR